MSRSLKTVLDEANQNKLGAALHLAKLGTILSLTPRTVRLTVATNVGVLPEGAKARALLSVVSTVGTTTGVLTPVATGTTPTTGQVAIGTTGNVVFAAADAVTQAEVTYLAEEGAIIEETLPVATNVATLSQSRRSSLLLEATATVGTTTGAETIVARGATPTTTQAALNAAGSGVVFAAADAVTQCTVKYVAFPGDGIAPESVVADLLTEDKAL